MKTSIYFTAILGCFAVSCSPELTRSPKSSAIQATDSKAVEATEEASEELAAQMLIEEALQTPEASLDLENSVATDLAGEIRIDVANLGAANNSLQNILKAVLGNLKNDQTIVPLATGILFKKVDVNSDGVLSQDELVSAFNPSDSPVLDDLGQITQIFLPQFLSPASAKPNLTQVEAWLQKHLQSMRQKATKDPQYSSDLQSRLLAKIKDLGMDKRVKKDMPWMNQRKKRKKGYLAQRLISKYYACAYEFKGEDNAEAKCTNIVLTSENNDIVRLVKSKISRKDTDMGGSPKPIPQDLPYPPAPPTEAPEEPTLAEELAACKKTGTDASSDIAQGKASSSAMEAANIATLQSNITAAGFTPARIYDIDISRLKSIYDLTQVTVGDKKDSIGASVNRVQTGQLYKIVRKPNIKLPAGFKGPENGYAVFAHARHPLAAGSSSYFLSYKAEMGAIQQLPKYVLDVDGVVVPLHVSLDKQVQRTINTCRVLGKYLRLPSMAASLSIYHQPYVLHWFDSATSLNPKKGVRVQSPEKIIRINTKNLQAKE